MKTVVLIVVMCCTLLQAQEPKSPAHFVTRIYYPELLYRMGPIEGAHGDPMEAAKTDDQRRFVKAYLAVRDEDRRKPVEQQQWRDTSFPWVEALRRCGIQFPEGATVRWLPIAPPLLVTHTPETMKRIGALMDLQLTPPR
jgi:hypothetical protein